jgi:hypothetical protein
MPSPQALGLTPASPVIASTRLDWDSARRRMQELGVSSFKVDELPQGGWRFVCLLRTATAARPHRVEAGPAGSECEAVRLALDEAARWRAANP